MDDEETKDLEYRTHIGKWLLGKILAITTAQIAAAYFLNDTGWVIVFLLTLAYAIFVRIDVLI